MVLINALLIRIGLLLALTGAAVMVLTNAICNGVSPDVCIPGLTLAYVDGTLIDYPKITTELLPPDTV